MVSSPIGPGHGAVRTRVASLVGAVRLVHVFPSVTVITGSAVLLCVAYRGVPSGDVLARAVAVVAGSQVAVGALNDYVDRWDDARTQPEKPLPGGLVRPGVALGMVISGITVCCGFALTFGPISLAIVLLGLGSGLAYDLRLKRTPLSPLTYVVSFLSLFTWIWLVAGALRWWVTIMYPFGACLMLAAHLANALPDAETDRLLGQRGLVVVLGSRRALALVLVVCASGASGALAVSVVEGTVPGMVLSLAAGILVLSAASLARGAELDRRRLQLIFRCIAPSIALAASAGLLAFESLQ